MQDEDDDEKVVLVVSEREANYDQEVIVDDTVQEELKVEAENPPT